MSYASEFKLGPERGDRSPNLSLIKTVLCHLSYLRVGPYALSSKLRINAIRLAASTLRHSRPLPRFLLL